MSAATDTATRSGRVWLAAMPALFVLLWSTGFIGAKLGLPHGEPMTFLTVRFAIVAALLVPIGLLVRAAWPKSLAEAGHYAVAGALLHGGYLGGVFTAISVGIEAGTSALIVSIQPLLVAALAGLVLGEKVTGKQWLGLALGLLGVVLVVWEKLSAGLGTWAGVLLCLGSLLSITVATLYQKRYCGGMNLITGSAIQFTAATVFTGVMVLIFEDGRLEWAPPMIFAMGWLVVVLSLGAITLLYLLIRHGAAAGVSSLFFLVPPSTALIAWPLFGETFGLVALIGMACAVIGVGMVRTK